MRAREADPLAAFGGIVALNRALDVATAEAIVSTFIEAVIAPSVADDARPILATRDKMRVVLTDAASRDHPWRTMEWRSVRLGKDPKCRVCSDGLDHK